MPVLSLSMDGGEDAGGGCEGGGELYGAVSEVDVSQSEREYQGEGESCLGARKAALGLLDPPRNAGAKPHR